MGALQTVFEKTKTDENFAKDLLIDPADACSTAGISINTSEKKILEDAMSETRKYYAERLALATSTPDLLGNWTCIIKCS